MKRTDSNRLRRQFIGIAGSASLVGVAGCLADAPAGGDENEDGSDQECLEELDDSVPEAYETAQSIDGVERDPDEVASKEEAGYQCHPQNYQLCANCTYFIPSVDGDQVGACAVVAGEVPSQHWCALYEPAERFDERPDSESMEFGE